MAPMVTPRVPERHHLEMSFVRARWLGVAALGALATLAGWDGWPLWGTALLVLAAGNALVVLLSTRARSFAGQRRLGVAAAALDAAVVWWVALLAPSGLTPSIYTLFVLVGVEASIRFAPVRGVGVSGLLAASLGLVMALRARMEAERFDWEPFFLWAALVVLIGWVAGTAVREVYRQRSAASPLPPELDPETAESLTRRERQVLTMIVRGHSNGQIAEALFIELKTVKNHINNIYGKLHLNSRYQAIALALSQRGAWDDEAGDKDVSHA